MGEIKVMALGEWEWLVYKFVKLAILQLLIVFWLLIDIEGFTFWKSDTSWNWNSVDMGPKRDIVSELKASFDETNVTFGLYFSLYEWFNPWYKRDKLNDFETQEFVHKKIRHQLQEIVERYSHFSFISNIY